MRVCWNDSKYFARDMREEKCACLSIVLPRVIQCTDVYEDLFMKTSCVKGHTFLVRDPGLFICFWFIGVFYVNIKHLFKHGMIL